MSDIIGSLAAAARYNGKVIGFSQLRDLCDALVSRWIRKRFRNKDFFTGKYFRDWSVPAAQKAYVLGSKSWREPEGKEGKGFKLSESPGGAMAQVMQKTFLGQPEHSNAYIESGKRDRPAPARVDVLKVYPLAARVEVIHKHRDLDAIPVDFREIDRQRLMASFSFRTTTGSAHACALDARIADDIRYFDPNIGEFRFTAFKDFEGWWMECLKTKSKEKVDEGFDMFLGQYSYTTYRGRG